MKTGKRVAVLAGALALGGCVSVPQGPTVAVMPGSGKSLEQFSTDSGTCKQFAQASVSGASQHAQDQAATNAAPSMGYAPTPPVHYAAPANAVAPPPDTPAPQGIAPPRPN